MKVIRRGGVSDPPEGRCGVAALPRQRGQGAEGLRAGVGKGRRAVRELQWRQHSRAPENRSRLRETEGREEGTRVFFSQHPVETLPGAPNPHPLAWSAGPPPPPGLLASSCLPSASAQGGPPLPRDLLRGAGLGVPVVGRPGSVPRRAPQTRPQLPGLPALCARGPSRSSTDTPRLAFPFASLLTQPLALSASLPAEGQGSRSTLRAAGNLVFASTMAEWSQRSPVRPLSSTDSSSNSPDQLNVPANPQGPGSAADAGSGAWGEPEIPCF